MALKKLAMTGLAAVARRLLSNYALRIPRAQLQAGIARQFPLIREKYRLAIILEEPQVQLDEANNRVGLELTVAVQAPGNLRVARRARIDGRLWYHREAGELYLVEPRVRYLDTQGWLGTYDRVIEVMAETVLDRQLAATPVYTLDRTHPVQALLHTLVKTITVQGDRVVIEFGWH